MERLSARGRWPEDVELWSVPLDLSQSISALPFIDDGERVRAMRYRRSADQIRFAATRSALRRLLADAVKADPGRLRFELSDAGKPRLAGRADVSFNVSHAGEYALIALSHKRDVGIDVEAVNAAIDWRELAPLVCTVAERRVLDSELPARQAERFFRCWTAKEALLKALGVGITEGLQALTVDLTDNTGPSPQVVVDASAFEAVRALQYRWLNDVPGYVGCLAYGPARP